MRLRHYGAARKIVAVVTFITAIVLTLLSGCGVFIFPKGSAAYGSPSPPGDPDVAITSFKYEPASALQVGDTIRFEATINQPADGNAYIPLMVIIGDEEYFANNTAGLSSSLYLPLYDYGVDGDEVAGDLVFTGEYAWREEYGACDGIPVTVAILWESGAPWVYYSGFPLTVTEPEGESQ